MLPDELVGNTAPGSRCCTCLSPALASAPTLSQPQAASDNPHRAGTNPTPVRLLDMHKEETLMRLWKLFALSLFAAGTAACSTVEGIGEDVEEVGEEIQETSRNNR